jgi:acetoin utilization deacetylase AcuC-like enzyme
MPNGREQNHRRALASLRVTAEGFARAGAAIAGLGLPAAICQEGGYAVDHLGALLERFIKGWGG